MKRGLAISLLACCGAFYTATLSAQDSSCPEDCDSADGEYIQVADSAASSDAAIEEVGYVKTSACDCCEPKACGNCCDSPWTFSFTGAVGYGTNLALPLTLTPANTLIVSNANILTGVGAGIIDVNIANGLGLADNLGLNNVVTADVPSSAFLRDDFEFQVGAGAYYRQSLRNDASLTIGYALQDNRHSKIEQLDLQSHIGSARYDKQISDRAVGSLEYKYSYYFLSDTSYLNSHYGEASIYVRQNDSWDWKVRAGYGDVTFFNTKFLDSENYSAGIEVIRYIDGNRTDYLTAGFGTGDSNAVFDGFGYTVNNVFIGGRWLCGSEDRNELRVTGSYGMYDFDAADPIQVGTVRNDDIWTVNAIVTRAITESFSGYVSYTWYEADSNVVRQNYQQHSVFVGGTVAR